MTLTSALRDVAGRFLFRHSLAALCRLHDTDKDTVHRYAQHYARHFGALRRQPITLLEIGVGGYSDPYSGGGSLRMWRDYFPKGKIYGIDIHDKTAHDGRRIKTFRGSQSDVGFLGRVVDEIGPPDIVIDDGSHFSRDVIASFEYLFPLMADRGIYVVEDLQTSYWDDWGGNDQNPDTHTAIGYFKELVHGLNYEERPSGQQWSDADYFDQHITGLSFYHNLVFVQKGSNREGGRYRAAEAI